MFKQSEMLIYLIGDVGPEIAAELLACKYVLLTLNMECTLKKVKKKMKNCLKMMMTIFQQLVQQGLWRVSHF